MSKIKFILLITVFFFLSINNVFAIELDLYSENVVLYNLDENTILYEKNSEEEISIASLTKIMTAIVAIENIESLERQVTLIQEDKKGLIESNASTAGFYIGETVTIKDLLYGLLLPSGADAAQTLTRILGGKVHFIELMNQKAKELNMNHTHFQNETGLDEKNHYSSVKDIATLFQYALKNETFKKIIETEEYETSNKRLKFQSTVRKWLNKSNLKMDYLIGGKTGTTENAGLCLASIASENNTNYMLITARAKNNWQDPTHLYDAKTIYEYFIENYERKIILRKEEPVLKLKSKYAKESDIVFYLENDIEKYVPKDIEEEITTYYDGLEEITPWIKKGTVLGNLKIFYQGELLQTKEIKLESNITFDILKFINQYQKEIAILFILILICFIIIIKKKVRN